MLLTPAGRELLSSRHALTITVIGTARDLLEQPGLAHASGRLRAD